MQPSRRSTKPHQSQRLNTQFIIMMADLLTKFTVVFFLEERLLDFRRAEEADFCWMQISIPGWRSHDLTSSTCDWLLTLRGHLKEQDRLIPDANSSHAYSDELHTYKYCKSLHKKTADSGLSVCVCVPLIVGAVMPVQPLKAIILGKSVCLQNSDHSLPVIPSFPSHRHVAHSLLP